MAIIKQTAPDTWVVEVNGAEIIVACTEERAREIADKRGIELPAVLS